MRVVEERLAVDGELLDVDVTDDGSWVGQAERIGIREGQLRGLTGGRFLAAGTTGYTIVSTSNSKAVWERCRRCS
jgi:hypothetical protein